MLKAGKRPVLFRVFTCFCILVREEVLLTAFKQSGK